MSLGWSPRVLYQCLFTVAVSRVIPTRHTPQDHRLQEQVTQKWHPSCGKAIFSKVMCAWFSRLITTYSPSCVDTRFEPKVWRVRLREHKVEPTNDKKELCVCVRRLPLKTFEGQDV